MKGKNHQKRLGRRKGGKEKWMDGERNGRREEEQQSSITGGKNHKQKAQVKSR